MINAVYNRFFSIIIDGYQRLLTDTKLTKYIRQQVIASDVAGNLSEMMD